MSLVRSAVVPALLLLLLVSSGCGLLYRPMHEPAPRPVEPTASAVSRAIAYLDHTQMTEAQEAACPRDWAGNWPQYVSGPAPHAVLRVRDVTPFLATFVHHALALVTPENAEALGLGPADLDRARTMRLRAVRFMQRFETEPEEGVPGTFAFWPRDPPRPRGIHAFLGDATASLYVVPPGGGRYGPWNLPAFPTAFRIWPDQDGTSVIRVALHEHARVDGGSPPDGAFADVFSAWRHDGRATVHGADWLQRPNGAFLTYVGHPRRPDILNDVDLVANANVLLALGLHGRTDVPGVVEAVAFIVGAVQDGRHRRIEDVSTYYPDNHILAYAVARAWRLGGIEGLEPAVMQLADEIEAEAILGPDGTVHWNRGDPQLDTAFAALALLHAGRSPRRVEGAVRWIRARQDASYGGWAEGTFFYGLSTQGVGATWSSRALTTGLALELLIRARLWTAVPAHGDRGSTPR